MNAGDETLDAMPDRSEAVRLVIVCTGSINAAFLPWSIGWLRTRAPQIDFRLVLTRSASRFVSPDALSVIAARPVQTDAWPETFTTAPHVELAEWADAFAVYPASAHYLARLAAGLADTPSLLALQCTNAPVAVAPALPEGLWETKLMQRHVATITERDNVTVVCPEPGRSWTTGRQSLAIPPPFPRVLRRLLHRLAVGAADTHGTDGTEGATEACSQKPGRESRPNQKGTDPCP